MRNLPGLYYLSIKRIKGNVWSFKFIYSSVIEWACISLEESAPLTCQALHDSHPLIGSCARACQLELCSYALESVYTQTPILYIIHVSTACPQSDLTIPSHAFRRLWDYASTSTCLAGALVISHFGGDVVRSRRPFQA